MINPYAKQQQDLKVYDREAQKNLDYTQDYAENRKQVEIYEKNMKERHAREEAPIDRETWKLPGFKAVLKDIYFER